MLSENKIYLIIINLVNVFQPAFERIKELSSDFLGANAPLGSFVFLNLPYYLRFQIKCKHFPFIYYFRLLSFCLFCPSVGPILSFQFINGLLYLYLFGPKIYFYYLVYDTGPILISRCKRICCFY